VMVRSQRNQYDHAARSAGVHIVEVGLPDRVAGAGVRDAEPWEIAAAVTERTAAIVYVANANARPTIEEVARVANSQHVPLLVDAAAQLPPAANLRRFIAAGANLVAFSGGKAIGGPQGSGILCGGRDLIMSAVLQQLDLDIAWEQWSPPPSLIDKDRLAGLPPHGIGRQCKVGKETIVGLLVALRRFLAENEQARYDRLLSLVKRLDSATGSLRNARTEVRAPADGTVSQTDRLQVGATAVTGVPVVTLVRSATTYVEANYKETDLANMYVGQPAEIKIDAYPGVHIHGHVASIGAGTGSQFSVLPAQNASGNWVKVRQRVPVRIAIDGDPGRPMLAGLSAEITVDTRDRPAQRQASR